jgi:hypothetical protein
MDRGEEVTAQYEVIFSIFLYCIPPERHPPPPELPVNTLYLIPLIPYISD